MSDTKLKILEDTIRRLKEREEPIKKPSPKWENVFVAIQDKARMGNMAAPIGTLFQSAKFGIIYPSKDVAETNHNNPKLIEPNALNVAWKYKGAFPLEE